LDKDKTSTKDVFDRLHTVCNTIYTPDATAEYI
jgi:hypothetical protein